MRETIIGITEFRDQAKQLVDQLEAGDVVLIRHSRPVGRLIHPDRFERLLTRIEDLEDEVAVLRNHYEPEGTVSHEIAVKEMLSVVDGG